MANMLVTASVLALAFCSISSAFPEADLDGVEPLPAFRVQGGQLESNLTGMQSPALNIFGRQSCGQGYSQCGKFQ
jgi:hypothetical protein